MKLTRKKAFELSIKKWELIIENNGKEPYYPPEIEELFGECGLCEKYLYPTSKVCTKCPISLEYENGCVNDYHPFSVWLDQMTKENAQAVLDLIKSKQ